MTASSASAGDPRWVIEFHNGDYLFGQLPDGTTPQSTLTWSLEPAGTAEPSWAAALAAADAGGADNQVTSAFIVDDAGYAGTAVNVSDITYNGQAVVPYVKPRPGSAPAPLRRPRHHGQQQRCPDRLEGRSWRPLRADQDLRVRIQPEWLAAHRIYRRHHRLLVGPGAGHTYDIELIPAGANRQPLPHAQVGWINIVTTR